MRLRADQLFVVGHGATTRWSPTRPLRGRSGTAASSWWFTRRSGTNGACLLRGRLSLLSLLLFLHGQLWLVVRRSAFLILVCHRTPPRFLVRARSVVRLQDPIESSDRASSQSPVASAGEPLLYCTDCRCSQWPARTGESISGDCPDFRPTGRRRRLVGDCPLMRSATVVAHAGSPAFARRLVVATRGGPCARAAIAKERRFRGIPLSGWFVSATDRRPLVIGIAAGR